MGRLHLVPVGKTEVGFLRDLSGSLSAGLPFDRFRIAGRIGETLDPERNQVLSTDLLEALDAAAGAGTGDRVLGVATGDLFIPILTFVFGEARRGGPTAVFSTARLDPAFYGMPADPRLLFERAVKEARHELGHTFGLVHCREPDCVMRASTDAGGVDVKSAGFCRSCRREIRRSS